MGDGEDADVICSFEIDDVIGEPHHAHSSDLQVGGHTRHRRAGAREIKNLADGRIHGVEELEAEVYSTTFVPTTGGAILNVRFVFKANAWIHRFGSSASARRRTSSQGTPTDSPAITRRARRSISAAHAASTSARFSVSAASRLASNSAATSARSAIGNARASRRTACTREVMRPFYT